MEFFKKPSAEETKELLPQWSWIVPDGVTPLFLTSFGDWVFGEPDGSLSVLSMLEVTYETVAHDTQEYNQLNKSTEWCDEIFLASWLTIAIENGIVPKENECIGWEVHPIVGGEFSVDNLKIFDTGLYQSLMSQLHAQIRHLRKIH